MSSTSPLCPTLPAPRFTSSLSSPCPSSSCQPLPPLIPVPYADSSSSSSSPHNVHPMITRSKAGTFKPKALISSLLTEPATVHQALQDPHWRAAMAAEYSALLKNHTWTLVPAPTNANIVGCRWIFKLKYRPDGSVDRYKARLVAKGFSQSHGVDYFETFSPVVKPSTIRIVLTLALSSGWPIRQLDIHNAFLHGDLREVVHMQQPPGFEDPQHPTHVCYLHKALYGLKQAPRAWFHKLSTFLLQAGFQCSRADSSLFFCHTANEVLIILIYVDDILVTGSSLPQVQHFISTLNSTFALRDLGPINYFLGVEVSHQPHSLHLNQHKYLLDLLQRTNMQSAKPASTPGAQGRTLSANDGHLLPDPTIYRSTVGALQYLTITRPDIAFAVNKACQFMARPTDLHWLAVKRILRYLKGTPLHGLHLHASSSLDIHGYSDADWASCPDDRRSTSGYCLFLGPNLVSWCSAKQRVVSRSSAESEYRSLASLTAEVVWVQSLLKELCVPQDHPPMVWCDNKSAAALAANSVFHARTKHIEIDLHFIRDKVLQQDLTIHHVPSTDQVADVFTKHLSSAQFNTFRVKLSVVPKPVHLRGGDNQKLVSKHTSTVS